MFNFENLERSRKFEGITLRNSYGHTMKMSEQEYSLRESMGLLPQGYRKVTVINPYDSPLVQSIKRKLIAEEEAVNNTISRFEVKELLTCHKYDMGQFFDLRQRFYGVKFSSIIDVLDKVSKELGAKLTSERIGSSMREIQITFPAKGKYCGTKNVYTFWFSNNMLDSIDHRSSIVDL